MTRREPDSTETTSRKESRCWAGRRAAAREPLAACTMPSQPVSLPACRPTCQPACSLSVCLSVEAQSSRPQQPVCLTVCLPVSSSHYLAEAAETLSSSVATLQSPPPRRRLFGITSNTLVRSSRSSSGPAGGASDGYGLGRRAAGPDRRCKTTAAGELRVIV